jgi:hypothetical protein
MNSASLGLAGGHGHGGRLQLGSQTRFVARLDDARAAEQRTHRVRRLGTNVEPVVHALDLQIDGVLEVHDIKANQWKIVAKKDENMRVRLFDFAKNNNYTLIKIQQQEQNMEDVFKQLTGK